MDEDLLQRADDRCLKYYARAEYWKNREAVCLLLGFDPRSALISTYHDLEQSRVFRDLLVLLERARSDFKSRDRVTPTELVNWAGKCGFNISKRLVFAVKEAKRRAELAEPFLTEEKPTRAAQAGELHHKTKASLLKLIAGMAVLGYAYQPAAGRNQAVTEIESDLRKLGIPLSDDTIRKWLEIACELIDLEAVDPAIREKLGRQKPK